MFPINFEVITKSFKRIFDEVTGRVDEAEINAMIEDDTVMHDNQQELNGSFLQDGIPFAYLILDKKKILKATGFLQDSFERKKINEITDVVSNYDSKAVKQTAVISYIPYVVYTQKFAFENEQGKSHLSGVFFVENDGYRNNAECRSERPIVGLIFIDNYEEVLDNTEEVRRPLLIALIDRKVNALAQQVSGIIKHFEKDKYIFVLTNDKLEYLKEKKFEILTQIREIDMGNKIPVTLSIGLGVNGTTLAQNMEYARAAIDLALGRGGDQVLIKDNDKYYFFGGVAKEVSSNGRVRARVKSYAFAELVEESDNVIVLGHKNIDLDCLGAGIGVCKIVSAMGRDCNIVLGEVTTNIKYLYERLVLEKEYKDKIFLSAEQAAKKVHGKTLIVVVDTHRPSIVEGGELLSLPGANRVVVFDHHRKATEFIDNPVLTYHEPYASSTCELITEMLQYSRVPVKLKAVEADALLAGITVDTKNFAIKTGAKTFEAAAYLRRNGADSVKVKMLFQNDLASFKAKAVAVNNAEVYNENMAISISPSNVENPTLIAAQAADELLNIFGIQASFVLCKSENTVYVSARSLGGTNVQLIMEKLGGGGHQTVAGAQVQGKQLEDVEEMLKIVIEEYLEEAK